MLLVTYLRRELRHRLRQAVFVGLGLALGVGLVITVSGATAGVRNAQRGVLHSLFGVGTDATVTKAYSEKQSTAQAGPNIYPGAPAQHIDTLNNSSQGLFAASTVGRIAAMPHVTGTVGYLALVDSQFNSPAIPKSGSSGAAAPPSMPTAINVDGVDIVHTTMGPLSQAQVSAGRAFTVADADAHVALVDSNYARAHKLTVGSTITLAKTPFKVIGIVDQPAGAGIDVLIPLAPAQALSGLRNQVNNVAVSVASASDVSAVVKTIGDTYSWANVTTSASLANTITGSLGSAQRLATDLGIWLAVVALIAAFALAALLTVAAVSRRVREFGTLKALGWPSRRIVVQVMSESVTVGVIGSMLGVGLGLGGLSLVSQLAPTLTGTVAAAPGTQEPQGMVMFQKAGQAQQTSHFAAPGSYHNVPVHFHAPFVLNGVILAVLLGIAGGLLAGALGGWRAARLRPAAALARVA